MNKNNTHRITMLTPWTPSHSNPLSSIGDESIAHTSTSWPQLTSQLKQLVEGFQDLQLQDAPTWPLAPRLLLCALVFTITLSLGWWWVLEADIQEYKLAQTNEQNLRHAVSEQLRLVVKPQPQDLQELQTLLSHDEIRKQLPEQAQTDTLLQSIHQAAQARLVQINLLRSLPAKISPHYVEQPMTLQVTGSYRNLSAFIEDVTKLQRIVKLSQLELSTDRQDRLNLQVIATSFHLPQNQAQSLSKPVSLDQP